MVVVVEKAPTIHGKPMNYSEVKLHLRGIEGVLVKVY